MHDREKVKEKYENLDQSTLRYLYGGYDDDDMLLVRPL